MTKFYKNTIETDKNVINWFRVVSRLWFIKFPAKSKLKSTGEEIYIIGYRQASFGPAFSLKINNDVVHGFSPESIELSYIL